MTPGKTFKISASLSMQNMIDVEINAHGATITSAMTTSGPMVTLYDTLGKRCHIRGGLWKLTGGSGNPWFFSFAAQNCTLEGVHCIKTPDAGGYHMYVFNTAPGFKAIGNRFEGSNGIYIETSDALFLGNSLVGQVSGGDDCFAVKGLNSSSRNLRFIGNYIEALSNGLAIGSEIGVLGANDATYSRSVGQIVFVGNTLKECSGVVSIKPGAIAGADYRDGTVEDVVISNNTLIDESGARFVRGIAFYAGKGGRIRNVFGRNNTIRARALTATGRVAALDFYIVSDAGGTAEAAISNIDLEIAFTDPYGGVANDVSHPGYPVNSIIQAELADTSIGSMSNISLSVTGDGCTLSGIDIGASLDDAFTISRASLTNINNNLSSAQGGIRASSRMTVGTDISISVVGGQPYRIESTGEILCPELEQQVFLYTQVNAGNADTQYPWVAKRRCLLTEILLGTTLSIAQSDTNYTSLTIRNLGSTGNVFNTAETKATGSSGGANPLFSLTAQQYSTIFLYRTNLSTESKFARGSVLMMSKADTGAGATLQNARMIVRALPY
jgi:hypothetical protein